MTNVVVIITTAPEVSAERFRQFVSEEDTVRAWIWDPSFDVLKNTFPKLISLGLTSYAALLMDARKLLVFWSCADKTAVKIIAEANKRKIGVEIISPEVVQETLFEVPPEMTWAEQQEAAFEQAYERLIASPMPGEG